MADFTILYFSGTGNTWWVASRLRDALRGLGHSVLCRSIEGVSDAAVRQYLRGNTHLVLGFPVYGSLAPKPMLRFMEKLPGGGHRPASLFGTQALASGDTATHAGLALRKKGWRLAHTRHFRMPNNLHLPMFRFSISKPDNGTRRDRMLRQAEAPVERFAKELSRGGFHLRGRNPCGALLGGVQRSAVGIMEEALGEMLAVAPERCTHCGLCKKLCPVSNIADWGGEVQFLGHCAACLRCYSRCPQQAILVGKGSEDAEQYPRYKGPPGYDPLMNAGTY